MQYISASQASLKWGISIRQVQRLLAGHRISGARKFGRSWMIPLTCDKPSDPRGKHKNPEPVNPEDFQRLLEVSANPMPLKCPDEILSALTESSVRLQYEGELAYLRGDFEQTMRCFSKTDGDAAARLRACPVAIAASVSLGDYTAYQQIDAFLISVEKHSGDQSILAFADLARATLAVSVIAPDMAPEWIREGDFSGLPAQCVPDALYLRAKYLHSVNRYEAMLALSQTALTLYGSTPGITVPRIYLYLMCAVAFYSLDRMDDARKWINEAMRIALPHGFITPFSELVTTLGGLVESCLGKSYPECFEAIVGLWKRTWKNWIAFHNQFAKDKITLVLTLREYHIALLVARRVPYSVIAQRYYLSVGRVKNIVQGIYGKLFISGRDELGEYVF